MVKKLLYKYFDQKSNQYWCAYVAAVATYPEGTMGASLGSFHYHFSKLYREIANAFI